MTVVQVVTIALTMRRKSLMGETEVESIPVWLAKLKGHQAGPLVPFISLVSCRLQIVRFFSFGHAAPLLIPACIAPHIVTLRRNNE